MRGAARGVGGPGRGGPKGRAVGRVKWEVALGPDYLDDHAKRLLRQDYGLVELSFQREGGTWSCFGVSVQAHRLLWGVASVPGPVRDAYGLFARRVRFDELRDVITGLGHTVEPDDDGTATDMHRYRIPGSGARIMVVADPDPYGYGGPDPNDPDERQAGDVWSISLSPAWWSAKN